MVSDAKTSTAQLDLLMEALKTSIRKALDEDLAVNEATDSEKLNGSDEAPSGSDSDATSEGD